MKSLAARLLRAWSTPTGLACSGMALICGGIVSNALLLQHGKHPAPLFSTRLGGSVEVRAAATSADPVVQAVQKQLSSAGYYDGPVDGIPGTQTRAAILSFERRTGLRETGVATSELITGIESWAARGPRSVPAEQASAPPPAADPKVAAVQEALARAAYGPLVADGVFGKQTHDAIIRFQLDQGVPLTGTIDDGLVKRLKSVGALEGA